METCCPATPPAVSGSGGLEGLEALPPLQQGPVGQALGCLHTVLASSSPPGSKILISLKLFTSFKIVTAITKLRFSIGCHPDRT